jgi:Glycosyl transferase family 2
LELSEPGQGIEMRLWAVTMVKDEIDIIVHTLGHLAASGVDGIIVADNLSTDGTWPCLQRLELPCQYKCIRDVDEGYYQSEKMTRLAHTAFELGADWVIPFDADELWYNAAGDLRDVFEKTDADCLTATLYNYFPTTDDPDELNPFLRITNREPTAAPLHKVAVRNRSDVVIAQGNHGATANSPFEQRYSTLEVAHFPWRGWERFERKIRNGYAAYRKTNLSADTGAHWRNYGQLLEEQGSEALRSVYEAWFENPPGRLEHAPAPLRTLGSGQASAI